MAAPSTTAQVVAIVGLGPVRRVTHPVQIGPGAEGSARPANEDRAHMVGAVQGLERLMQGGDGGGVKGVLLFRPVEGDEDDAVGRGVDPNQIIVRIRRGVRDQGMGDAVDLRRLRVGDVQGVDVGVVRLIGHVLISDIRLTRA
jgi:hypothetical protein